MQAQYQEIYPEYLTTGAVARYCGVSKVTVLRWIEQGNLTAFKLPGGQNRIHRDDFFAFASKHSIPLKGNVRSANGFPNNNGNH